MEICIHGKADRYTVFRLLNRVTFAFNEPIVFMLLVKAPGGFKVPYVTPYDLQNKLNFEEALADTFQKDFSLSDEPEIFGFLRSRADTKDCLIKLFDTEKFSLIAFAVDDPIDAPYFSNRRVGFNIVRNSGKKRGTWKFLRDVFGKFDGEIANLNPGDSIADYLSELFDGSFALKAEYDGVPISSRELLREALTVQGHKRRYVPDYFDDVLKREQTRICQSPLLRTREENVPNLLLFRKQFVRCADEIDNTFQERYDGYRYDAAPLVELKELTTLTRALQGRRNFPGLAGEYRFQDRESDEWFRTAVEAGDAKLLHEALHAPLSSCIRLAVDYTLFTGTALIYRNPFDSAQLGWIAGYDPTSSKRSDEQRVELRRLAVLHYYLLAGAPAGVTDPYLLILPIRVSGAVAMATVSVIDGGATEEDIGKEYAGAELADAREFQYRTFLYHSLIREFEGRVRRKYKEQYLRAVADLVTDVTFGEYASKTTDNMRTLREGLSHQDFDVLNNRLLELARFCPYDFVSFYMHEPERFEDNEIYSGKVQLSEDAKLYFSQMPRSPYFDRAQLNRFLDADYVRIRLQDIINARIGERRAFHTSNGGENA